MELHLDGLRYFERIDSTNVEAARWAGQGAPDMALVIADEQTAGRGRQGRKWFTPPGAALAFSLILRDFPQSLEMPHLMARLTALGALAVSQALQEKYGLPAEIKWPNDVLLERRKACGILAEAHWQGEQLEAVILGIGVNVAPAAAPPDGEVIFPATSVETILRKPVDRLELLRTILEELLTWRAHLLEHDFLRAWEARLAFRQEWVHLLSDAPVSDQQVMVLGVGGDGCLRVRDSLGKEFSVHTGEVRLRP